MTLIAKIILFFLNAKLEELKKEIEEVSNHNKYLQRSITQLDSLEFDIVGIGGQIEDLCCQLREGKSYLKLADKKKARLEKKISYWTHRRDVK